MRPDVAGVVRGADISSWKPVSLELGDHETEILVRPARRRWGCGSSLPLSRPGEEILLSLEEPIGTPPLPQILKAKGKPAGKLTVCIATSDITRPVPYKGESGILEPLLGILHECGVRRENVTLLVGTGTHRPSTPEEKIGMFGEKAVAEYRIVDHSCEDQSMLTYIGRTRSGTEIHINRHFVEADVRIATGLVEAHFMAGVSAGRKAVCPALVSRKTIERFHSAQFLSSRKATNLVLEGNPCHEEALEIARRSGVDFHRQHRAEPAPRADRRLFRRPGGSPTRSAAISYARVVAIPVPREYDIVLTHGGYVGINHYQNAKAACNALPVVREGGFVILGACERDADPVGPDTYRTLVHLLKLQGPDGYLAALLNPAWKFTRDQWEPQMWGKAIAKVGEEGLIYCTAFIPEGEQRLLPGTPGWDFLPDRIFPRYGEATREMIQNALLYAFRHPKWGGAEPSVAFIKEGPYAIPFLRPADGNGK